MPVVPLNQFHGTKGVHDVDSDRLGRVSEHRLLVALDSTQTLEGLGANLELLLGQLDILNRLRQKTKTAARRSERIPWQTLDLYLKVFDFIKAVDESRKKSNDALRNGATPMPAKNDKELTAEFYDFTNQKLTTPRQLEQAVIKFRRWEEESEKRVENYHQIT
jgi:hypothetical protein